MTHVDDLVRAAIERRGPLPFDQVMELALYDADGGFYSSGGRAGRSADFVTSPEVGPLFGAILARALDTWWRERGEPEVFVVVEAGAGPGTLARTVLHAAPECAHALRYVMVETSASQRGLHRGRLALEDPETAFAEVLDPDDDRPTVAPPAGPIVVSLGALPRLPGPCVVFANELLDNLPFGVAVRTGGAWSELHVGADEWGLTEVLLPLAVDVAGRLDEATPAAPERARIPLPRHASAWLRDACALAGRGGRVVAIDYARPAADLAARPWADWLRTYRAQERGGPPLSDLGTQDITGDVPIDLLDPAPARVTTQLTWLAEHGLVELVEEGRRTWHERAAIGDLAAVRARSRINESDALTDPEGLGAFQVLEWFP